MFCGLLQANANPINEKTFCSNLQELKDDGIENILFYKEYQLKNIEHYQDFIVLITDI